MSKLTVFLDLDGVCCDFATAALALHGKTVDDVTPGVWHLEKACGLTPEEFWRPVLAAGPWFWEELKPYPWLSYLLAVLDEAGAEVYVCSTPHRAYGSWTGKLDWVARHLSHLNGRVFLTEHKRLLAGPNRLLVDDSDLNCRQWRVSGGEAVLFPARWNSAHELAQDPVDAVRAWFEERKERPKPEPVEVTYDTDPEEWRVREYSQGGYDLRYGRGRWRHVLAGSAERLVDWLSVRGVDHAQVAATVGLPKVNTLADLLSHERAVRNAQKGGGA